MTKTVTLRNLLEKLEEAETALGIDPETGKNDFMNPLEALAQNYCALRPNAPLNKNELKSVTALLAYTAHTQHSDEETIRAIVETRFGVKNVIALTQKDYDNVIRFLVDLRLNEIMN